MYRMLFINVRTDNKKGVEMIHEWKEIKDGKHICTCGRKFDTDEELGDHISDKLKEIK